MQHAGVAARLMLGDGIFLFQHGDRLAGKSLEKAIRRRQSDDAAADDDEVALLALDGFAADWHYVFWIPAALNCR